MKIENRKGEWFPKSVSLLDSYFLSSYSCFGPIFVMEYCLLGRTFAVHCEKSLKWRILWCMIAVSVKLQQAFTN